jgi:glycosyltransferase involved in cell wall biosynthesis
MAAPPLRVLSIATVYPNSDETTFGIFVHWRILKMASGSTLKLMAPRGLIRYEHFRSRDKHLIVPPASKGWERDGELDVLRPRWFYLPAGSFLNGVLLFARLLLPVVLLQRKFPFDIIDTHFALPDGFAGALLAQFLGCPFAVTLRGNEIENSKLYWRRFAMSWALRRASVVIAVANNLRDLAIELGVREENAKVIPNGVNDTIFHLRDRTECRQRLGVPDGLRLLVSPGALIDRKGHHRVLAAIPDLLRQGFDVQLWIVGGSGGEATFEDELRAIPGRLGIEQKVRFFGHASAHQMAELMSAADLVCLATSREGWPNVVNEALACGTPVVVTDTGGASALVPDDRYGFVVPVGDAAALESALVKALKVEWDRRAISEWGRSRSWDKVGEDVLREFRAALKR